MNSLILLLAPIAVLLPAVAELSAPEQSDGTVAASEEPKVNTLGPVSAPAAPFRILEQAIETPRQSQMRIEHRVIVRISPSSSTAQGVATELPRQSRSDSYREQRLEGCVRVDGITAVEPAEDNRLLLFMRDRRVLSAALERSCNASDFYSGFYVERNEDGRLCSRRDWLQSRSGASCQVAQLNRLVAVRD